MLLDFLHLLRNRHVYFLNRTSKVGMLLRIAISQIDVASYLMFVSFINVFTRIRDVSCQGVYAI